MLEDRNEYRKSCHHHGRRSLETTGQSGQIGKVSPEELDLIVEGLNEIIGG